MKKLKPRGKSFSSEYQPCWKNHKFLTKECPVCKINFIVKPSQMNVRKCCSIKCSSISQSIRQKGQKRPDLSNEKNGRYKNGLYTIQHRVFETYLKQCSICGSIRNLLIHHKDKNRKNNVIFNLQIVCPHCHQAILHPQKNHKLITD